MGCLNNSFRAVQEVDERQVESLFRSQPWPVSAWKNGHLLTTYAENPGKSTQISGALTAKGIMLASKEARSLVSVGDCEWSYA